MDANIQAVGSVSGIVSVISIVIYGAYKCFQHFHFVSKCCGGEVSLDVDLGQDKTHDESVYLKLKNMVTRRPLPPSPQLATSLVEDKQKPSPLLPPPSFPVSRISSLQEAERLSSLEQHVRF